MTDTPATTPLHVERVPVSTISPHPRNVREGDVGAISESLLAHGQYRPIVVQRATPSGEPRNLVLAGNHTWKAAVALGWQDIDAVFVTVTDAQAVAIMLGDNRTHDLGRDDLPSLFALLRELDETPEGLAGSAWTREDLDDLLRDLERDGEDPLHRKGEQDIDPDNAPAVVPNPYVRRGEVYALGSHRVMCGDAADEADVARLLGDASISLIATDPPYGIAYGDIIAGRKNQRLGGWQNLKNDTEGAAAAVLTGRALTLARPSAAKGCAIFVWFPNGPLQSAFRSEVEGAGIHVLKTIVWVKPSLIFGRHEYHWRHESALYGWFAGSRARFLGERSETTVWEVDYGPGYRVRNGPAMAGNQSRTSPTRDTMGLGLHPTQKPVEITARPIRNHTRVGDVLYEPFSGSGSALIAAEQEGRVCLAMEIDPGYAQVTIERWERMTGGKAAKEDPE